MTKNTLSSRTRFAEWLRQRRKLLDLTQAELAEYSNCSTITIRKLEAGERKPSRELAENLAASLRIPSREVNAFIQFARSKEIDAGFRLPPWESDPTSWRPGQVPDPSIGGKKTKAGEPTVTLQYDLVALEAPRYDKLPGGRFLFRQFARGSVRGDIEGTITLRLTQILVQKPSAMDYTQALPMQFSALFIIQSGEEFVEGSYVGTMTPQLDAVGSGIAHVLGTGRVLSVSAQYADLFLNYIFVQDVVRLVEGVSTGAKGAMQFTNP